MALLVAAGVIIDIIHVGGGRHEAPGLDMVAVHGFGDRQTDGIEWAVKVCCLNATVYEFSDIQDGYFLDAVGVGRLYCLHAPL